MQILKTTPAVFAVGDTYQIMVPVSSPCLMWVKVGEECYYDDSNGIIRSDVTTHRMTVPMDELNSAGAYTVCFRKMIERKPYFSDTGDIEEHSFDFRPVPAENIKAYHIADAHNSADGPTAAAKMFEDHVGKLDLLILNGDIPNDSGNIAHFDNIYKIVEKITGGEIPTVFSRGNHDTRGIFAEKIADHTPVDNGNSYFTFRLGGLWGMVLDCGEDKPDPHPEYGNTVCCHEFRKRQTKFIRNVIKNADTEYNAPDVTHKVVISHIPFYYTFRGPFAIEKEIYTEWCTLLCEEIKPEMTIHGHNHRLKIDMPGARPEFLPQACPGIVGSVPDDEAKHFIGSGFVFNKDSVDITFNDLNETHLSEKIML